MAAMLGSSEPGEFRAQVGRMIDYAEGTIPQQHTLPDRLEKLCALALNELQQARQYDRLGQAWSREAFVHLYKFSM